MDRFQNPILNNTYILSTNIRSFGFILADTDEDAGKHNNFFEKFSFEPNIAAQIYHALRDTAENLIIAESAKGTSFMFFKPEYCAGIFTIVKRLDIMPHEMATIIRESFDGNVIYLGGEHTELPCDRDRMQDVISSITRSLAIFNDPEALTNVRLLCDIDRSYSGEYVFCRNGYSLFLLFLCMSASKDTDMKLSCKEYDNYKIISACIDTRPNISERLAYLSDVMEAQSLNLYYVKEDDKLKIAFLPYYIDDGKLGVKAEIDLTKILI